ncbi:hypothetical protein GGR55DRAFT_700162 [Xylaria sp. FL0064]|nr:hypothetical protein GGR55DRAFT_700162 [Xylaria sp. FL0064]
MEYIDPQLLGPDYVADTTHLDQGGWLYSDELNLEAMFTDNPCLELDFDYPAQPLEDANPTLPQQSYMANDSSYFPQQPSMPPHYPGFNPGVWVDSQPPYSHTQPWPSCTRCNTALCCPRCDMDNTAHAINQTAYPAIEPVSTPACSPDYHLTTPPVSPPPQSPMPLMSMPRRYTRRKGGAQTPEVPERPIDLADVVTNPVLLGKLEKPLSEMVAGIPDYRAFDMDAFVRRDKSERITKGKICRPNNGFILYRRAYDRAARFFAGGRGNAQNACRLLGMSWKMESDEVKKLFSNYARQEKDYHAYYFPSYKYNPKHNRPIGRPTGRKPSRRAASKAVSVIVGSIASDSDDDFINDSSDDDFKP